MKTRMQYANDKVYKYMTVSQLYPVANSIVVSGEGVEGTQLHPSFAQLGTGRVEVAADVGSGVGEAKQVKLLNTYTGNMLRGQLGTSVLENDLRHAYHQSTINKFSV